MYTYKRVNRLVLTACHRYWRDDWHGAIRPNRPNSAGRRPWQFIHSFYHLVSSPVPMFMLVFIYHLWFCTFAACFNGLEQSEVELRVYNTKQKDIPYVLFLFISVA